MNWMTTAKKRFCSKSSRENQNRLHASTKLPPIRSTTSVPTSLTRKPNYKHFSDGYVIVIHLHTTFYINLVITTDLTAS